MRYKLGEIGRIVTGKTPPTKNTAAFSDQMDKYLFVTPRDMNISTKAISKTERYLTDEITSQFKNLVLDQKSICVSCIGTVGKVFMLSGPAITNQQINSVTDIKKDICVPDFLYYYLSIHQKDIENLAGGTTMPIVNKTAFESLDIDLPDLETQKKVVRILSALDNKIELNNQQNQTLNRALDELYNEYEASALRKELLIPAKQLFTFEQGVEPGSKAYYSERLLGMVNFYRVGDMCEKCKNFINSDLAKGKILQKNDVVVSFDATIGRIAYGLEGAYSTGMKKISISNEYKKIVSNSFIYAYFRNKNTQDVMSQCAKGTTILHASSAIDSLAVPYDKNLLPELSKKISVIFDKLLVLKEETETLSKVRDVLLPRLMNGEVDINGIAAV